MLTARIIPCYPGYTRIFPDFPPEEYGGDFRQPAHRRSAFEMALFVATHIHPIDKKGRVTLPAPFRNAMAGQSFRGIVLLRSARHPCLEGFSWSQMEEISRRLTDRMDMFSAEQDALATDLFASAAQLMFDDDGRFLLPVELMEYGHIGEEVAFVGLGSKFQMWDPEILKKRKAEATHEVKTKNLSIPRGER